MLRRAQAARLLAVTPGTSGTRLLLLGRSTVSIGSAASVSLKLEQVAKRYSAIHYHGGRYFLTSLDRGSPTRVNERRVSGSEWLKHGDTLQFGPHAYRFIDPDGALRKRNRRFVQAAASAVAIAFVTAHAREWDQGLFAAVSRFARLNLAPAPPENVSHSHQDLARIAPTPTTVPQTVATVQPGKKPTIGAS